MRRSEALQGVRMVRFQSVLSRYQTDQVGQGEAAEMLGVSERTFRRWCRRFEEEGEAGLLDRRLGRPSPKRMSPDDEAEIERLYRTRYRGFTARHFHEHLARDHLHHWSYTRVKLLLQSKSLLEKAPRRGAHRRKRPRRPLPGMMLHQDGSPHEWLIGRDPLDLIVTMDDATNEIYSMILIEEEGTTSSFLGLLETFGARGLPLSLYTDRGSHYFFTPEAGGKVDRTRLTQVGRALARLGVEHIPAYSPEARGRSERMFRTLQDRLPKELALAGIRTMDAANAWLRETYIPAHNARFSVKPELEGDAFVPADGIDLAEVLCVEEERIVGNDNCVSFGNRKIQIPESPLRPHFVKVTVRVRRYPNGGMAIFHGPRCLGRYDAAGVPIGGGGNDGQAGKHTGPSRRKPGVALGAIKDASRRGAATSPGARSSLTAPTRDARSDGRSAPGNGPVSLTRKCRSETPLLRRTKRERADT